MHVLLRHSSRRLFYAGCRQWTASTHYAHDFGSISSAERFARSHQPATFEIVLRYDTPICELTLPIAAKPAPIASHHPG